MRLTMSAAVFLYYSAFCQAQEAKVTYPPMPEAVSSFGAAACDGSIYVYGGHIGKPHGYSIETVSGKFRRLNLANPRAWEELPGDVAVQGLALVTHGGRLIRVGGMQPRNKPGETADNFSIAACAMFDPKVGKWTALPDLPAGRSSHDAAVAGDRIIVAGGWRMNGKGDKSTWHDTTLILDLSKMPLKWESTPQPFKRRALNVAILDGKLFVVGGMGPNGTENGLDILDLKSLQWSLGPALPGSEFNGFTPAVCAHAGKLFASPPDGKLYRLNGNRNGWDEIGVLEKQRMVHRIVPAEKSIFVLGGASRNGNVTHIESLDPTRGVKQ